MASILDRFKEGSAEEKVVDASKKVKVGIIGTGWIAEAHVANYLRCPDVEIVAAADLVPGKAEKFCKDNGIEGVRCYPDHKSMLDAEELDAVVASDISLVLDLSGFDSNSKGTVVKAVSVKINSKHSAKIYEVGSYTVQLKIN